MKSLSLRPSRVRYGVLAFASILSMITYLDRVCFGTVAKNIQREFGLTNTEIGNLFFVFALAYSSFEVPSGWLGDVFGPRRTLIRIVLWWSAFTALSGCIWPFHWQAGPLMITGFGVLLTVRFLFGAGEAGAYPNISRAFHNWFPFTERGSAQGTVWMAGRFGGGITPFVVLGLIALYQKATGSHEPFWRHIFWILGVLGVTWCVVFWFWFRDQPEQHPSVNTAELALIRGEKHAELRDISENAPKVKEDTSERYAAASPLTLTLSPGVPGERGPDDAVPLHHGVPWRQILTSPNLWFLCLMYFCCSYGWYFNITWLPKYLEERYAVTVDSHGFFTVSLLLGAPLLLGSLACLIGGLLTDWFIRRTGNRKWGRRLFGIVGHSICAGCYLLCLIARSPYLFVLFVALAAFWNDLTMGSAWASCLDIGGRYSGIVSGCMNTIGNLGGAAAAIASGYLLDAYGVDRGWQLNFLTYGCVYIVAVLMWLGFDATKPVAVGNR